MPSRTRCENLFCTRGAVPTMRNLACFMFGGVIETTEGLRYDVITDRSGKPIPWCIAGPTCDSVDVCMRDEMFPEDMQEGDFIYIANAGAYTTAYASNFNGFPLPEVRVI